MHFQCKLVLNQFPRRNILVIFKMLLKNWFMWQYDELSLDVGVKLIYTGNAPPLAQKLMSLYFSFCIYLVFKIDCNAYLQEYHTSG